MSLLMLNAAITAAANYLGGKYLFACMLLEPCQMCAGAYIGVRFLKLFLGKR
jgi:tRNA(Arg) A34 adenosine deaminase TadA